MQGYGLHATRAGESEEDMTPERIAKLRAHELLVALEGKSE
jgi:hypothetical protein